MSEITSAVKGECSQQMRFRSNCPYLRQKVVSGIDIQDVEATLGTDARDHSAVTKYLREAQISHDSESSQVSIEDETQKFVDEGILMALAEEPFACFP
jgi:hypothetical protein